jgi:ribosome-binding protein aMBF1 (putative translation factor)
MSLIQKLRKAWNGLTASAKPPQVFLSVVEDVYLQTIKANLRRAGWSDAEIAASMKGSESIRRSERAEILGRLWTL